LLTELLGESDARTLRQFIINTFDGLGPDAADRILRPNSARASRRAS
jgi:DNA topoisomerase VI subunit B